MTTFSSKQHQNHQGWLSAKATLMPSTVHGTKDFVSLDPTIISAIKGK